MNVNLAHSSGSIIYTWFGDSHWSNGGWSLHSTSAPHWLNLHKVIPRIDKSTRFKWWRAWGVEFVHITVEMLVNKYWTMSSLHEVDETVLSSCLRMQLNDSTGPAPSHSTIKAFWLVYVAPTWPSFQIVMEQVWRPPRKETKRTGSGKKLEHSF